MTAGVKGLHMAGLQDMGQRLEEGDQLLEQDEGREYELELQPLVGDQTEESPPMMEGRLLRLRLERLGRQDRRG